MSEDLPSSGRLPPTSEEEQLLHRLPYNQNLLQDQPRAHHEQPAVAQRAQVSLPTLSQEVLQASLSREAYRGEASQGLV